LRLEGTVALIILDNVVERLRALPERSQDLLIVIPPEEEDLLLDDLIALGTRVLRPRGELIAAKSLPAAFEIL
jgi:hypothetical protein